MSAKISITIAELLEALKEAEQVGAAKGFDIGWHEHYLEWERQKRDPNHPITKANPYKESA